MSRPTTYEDTMRLFDGAVKDWLAGLEINYGSANQHFKQTRPILTVFARPERAFAEVKQLLLREHWMDPDVLNDEYKNLPLPIAAVNRLGWMVDPNRTVSPGRYRSLAMTDDGKVLGADYPAPVDISYEINFWTMKVFSEVHIKEWVNNQIGRRGASPSEFYLHVPHQLDATTGLNIWGTQLHSVRVEGWADLTAMEETMSGEEYRFVRFNLTLTVRAWIMHPLTPPDEAPPMALEVRTESFDSTGYDGNPFVQPPGLCPTGRINENLLAILDREYRAVFTYTLSDDVTAKASPILAPGQNIYPTYQFSFPDGGGSVQSRTTTPLPLLHVGRSIPVRMHFTYMLPAGAPDVYFEVLRVRMEAYDPNHPTWTRPVYSVAQQRLLPAVAAKWCRFEGYAREQDWIAFRWRAEDETELLLGDVEFMSCDPAVTATELVTDSDCQALTTAAWTVIGGATVTKQIDPVTGRRFLRVVASAPGDGVSQPVTVIDRAVFVLQQTELLRAVGPWSIVLDNDAVAPTSSETLNVDENWRETGIVSAPRPLGNTLRFRAIALALGDTLELSEVSLRGYTGPFMGSRVPL